MKFLQTVLLLSFFVFIFSITLTKSGDFNQDLGRHIKLGEIIVKTGQIPQINLFSFTHPSFPFINHHWLSEVIFYGISQLNINLLVILKVLLIMTAFAILIKYSSSRAGILPAMISALVFSPFFLDRSQIRPEIFGYLFFSILIFLLLAYPKNQRFLFLIPIIMLLWINIHISFIFGIFLVGLLLIKAVLLHKKLVLKEHKLLIIIILSFIVLFINPNGFQGAFYPFTIFGNYGYKIAENQNLFYLNGLTSNIWIKYFFLITPFIFISWILLIAKLRFTALIVFITFYLLAVFQSRHIPFFVLAAIPPFTLALKGIGSELIKKNIEDVKTVSFLLLTGIFITLSLLFVSGWYSNTYDMNKYSGIEVIEDAKSGTEFMKRNNLAPNVFNNFDIGGYLIYSLYPKYKFFVDNRPEAYPADFFNNIYVPLQLDKNFMTKIFDKYGINTAFIAHTDQTDWGKSAVINLYKDKNWKMVYLDESVVIFTKNSALTNLKNNDNHFNRLIENEENFRKLLQLLNFFNLIDREDLSKKTFVKAQKVNPSSCIVKKSLLNQYKNSLYLMQKAEELKKSSWYCL